MECYQESTHVYYPRHEYIGGTCTRCGETDPEMDGDEQERLKELAAATLAAGGYSQAGVPVPYATTYYDAEGSPVVRHLPHGYESA